MKIKHINAMKAGMALAWQAGSRCQKTPMRRVLAPVLLAQRLGYSHVLYFFRTMCWLFLALACVMLVDADIPVHCLHKHVSD